jgi:hypothetical protein
MIPRTLVPLSVSREALDSAFKPPRRRWTHLDSRTLVPQDLPVTPLEIETAIPAHVPLEVLAGRIVIPRDMPATPLPAQSAIPSHLPLTVLDSRVAVPQGAELTRAEIKGTKLALAEELPELLDPDVLTTGEVHLLPKPVESGAPRWGWPPAISSAVFHAFLMALVFLQPKLFPYRPPTQEEIELAHRSLGLVYLPPPALLAPKVAPTPPVSARIHIDPEFFRQIAPPNVEASPTPGGAAKPDLPAAPAPQLPAPAGSREEAKEKIARLETPKPPSAPSGLLLAPASPGRLLEDSMRRAAERGGSNTAGFGGPALSGPGGAAGAGKGYLGGTVQILTPTEGVDFNNYIARMLATVRRNWYAVIPESARMGEKGIVVLDFSVLKDGRVPPGDPQLMRSSSREPLDGAAISAIRFSNPFEPLPAEFSGPLVKFRFIFLYNIRLDQQ